MARPRKAGHRGRQSVKPVGQRFPIGWLPTYMTEPLPPVRYPVDVTCGITDWVMLCNGPDPTCVRPHGVGNCAFAGRQHYRMAKARAYGHQETWQTTNDLVQEYLTYNEGEDVGAVIADVLLSWYADGTIEAFAPVDHTNRAQCNSAMAAFHGLYVGVNLPPNANQRFAHHEPWTLDGVQPNPDDKHCLVKVKSDHDTDTWVTWGGLQTSTTEWTSACIEEAWVIITSEDVNARQELKIDQLRDQIDALRATGG